MLPGKKITPDLLLSMLRRRAWLIAIPPVVCLFVALIYSSRIISLYQADMLIAIDPQRVPDNFVRSTVTLETDRRMDALTVQVLSRTTLAEIIESEDLYPEQREVLPAEDVIALMRAHVRVDMETPRPRWGQLPQPTAFHLRFTYPDPAVAARVTQRLGSLFVERNTAERGALAGATSRFLEGQLVEARRKLEAQEARLESFRQRYGKELPTQLQNNMQGQMSTQLQVQGLVESIARDRDRRQILERLYRGAAAEPATVTVAQGSTPSQGAVTTGSPRDQLAAARSTLANLELRYRPDHPDVVRTKLLIAELEPKAAAEATRAAGQDQAPALPADPLRRESLRQMQAEIESLDRQVAFKEGEERRLRAQISEYQRRIEAVPGLESEWTSLTRDYDTLQTAYKELLTKSTAAQASAELEKQDIGERFRIVDPASVPVRPLTSERIRYNAGGLVFGLIVGFGIALLLEIRDGSFRTDGDVMEVLSLPVLACVPLVRTTTDRARVKRRKAWLSALGAASVLAMTYVAWTLKLWNSLV